MLFSEPKIPQFCASTSASGCRARSFSALQRAENSSILDAQATVAVPDADVSVLFSEPKIPQLFLVETDVNTGLMVSVLFSEPKIPQLDEYGREITVIERFSALQRAENSSIVSINLSCSGANARVSVLFSEPKIPQFCV